MVERGERVWWFGVGTGGRVFVDGFPTVWKSKGEDEVGGTASADSVGRTRAFRIGITGALIGWEDG